ncbi:hypothetical protein [Hymenobacter convexus]|uniref:hypothetical protein n=1 Tax=Hymenobacter sp. CA1UV-4 TaxID=3063782 RepID=UPI0027140CD3|nr:hypothetical protein [Hymenobacter sp. CA1UV-4]MDO7851661.1 hypothetical protein [Hymenobacter sp. CA1UV-4]
MSLLQKIRGFFAAKRPEEHPGPAPTTFSADNEAARSTWNEAYLIKQYKAVSAESKTFAGHYGDFNAFLYRADFDSFLRKEVLPFREPDNKFIEFLDKNHWQEKHPFNFPGPFYAGYSDTCGTGIGEAPYNVMNDSHCYEYVFRQPKDFTELLQMLDAAAVEVFDSYSSNGNDYWTYEACKEWWSTREQIIAALRDEELVQMNDGQAQAYINYLNGDAEADLQRYCYFLLNGTYPMSVAAILPSLDIHSCSYNFPYCTSSPDTLSPAAAVPASFTR